MKVDKIDVGDNIVFFEREIKSNKDFSPEVKRRLREHNEALRILLERLGMSRPGRPSSEKSRKDRGQPDKKPKKDPPGRKQLPSQRYPNVPVVEKKITSENPPNCSCCHHKMAPSGLFEVSERLTVIPRKHLICRLLQEKYKCTHCHGAMVTAALPPRIAPGSSYSDEMILDVGLSKYCDLLPIGRYAAMAARDGLPGLPPQSLIGLTHHLADFLKVIYEKLKLEVSSSKVICADETPHRMLEGGGEKKWWYLWGFSSKTSCFFDIHNTRSGLVASDFLKGSKARYLVSDVFTGYRRAISEVNVFREERGLAPLLAAYCHAHARRKFKEASESFEEETRSFLASYRQIYHLEGQAELGSPGKRGLRQRMGPYFAEIKRSCHIWLEKTSPRSSLGRAVKYFLKNLEGFTRCLEDPDIPLDNNAQERLLRSPVVGRKTWYGTHSERGARTNAVLFSLVGSCFLNKVNPREYFPAVVGLIHSGQSPPTPYEYLQSLK